MLQHILWLLLIIKQEYSAFLEIHPLSSHLNIDTEGIQDNGLSIHSQSVLNLAKFSRRKLFQSIWIIHMSQYLTKGMQTKVMKTTVLESILHPLN